MFKKIDFKGLKFKMWGYFVFFAAIIMMVLWLLQTVFLQTFYQSMKTAEIKKIGDSIIAEYGKSDFQDSIFKSSYNNGIMIEVLDEYGNPQMQQNTFENINPPHTDPQTLLTLFQKISQSKDGKTSYITTDQRVNGKILVYGAKLADTSSGEYYLYINSQIAPVDATTAVLQQMLIIVMIISLLLSLIISLFIASRFAKPITKITKTAAALAAGNYNVKFEEGDYSEINQLASTLNYATTELSKTDELRKELIANISHDLRTPLTMVKMYAELIRDVSGGNPEKRGLHTKVIIEESDRLSALITDMLDLSKLQSGTTTMSPKEFDLGEKSKTILNRFNVLSERDGYILKINCEPDVTVFADEQKIEQVIYNLVSNAVNYTGEDKTVTINIKKAGDAARFEVTDTGHGIPPEEQKQIWERYYKGNKTQHKRAVIGTGIGLSIVKDILEAHKATFGVNSILGKGSTFWFEL
jgi:signal transduction histidine kinase